MTHKPTIGIDLGSTNVRIGSFRNGNFELIEYMGQRKIPLYISFVGTEILIGYAAKNQAKHNPKNTIFDLKSLIGRKFDDPAIKNGREYWPFVVNNIELKPLVEITYGGQTELWTPEKILSNFLSKLKEFATEYLKESINDVAITVPATFNNAQRIAIKCSCSDAGINVLQLINEPMAAAIAYHFNAVHINEKTVLIFHFGGSTFDATVLTINNDVIDAKSTTGDTTLGGKSLDVHLAKNLVEIIKLQYGIDLSESEDTFCHLINKIEVTKKALTSALTAKIQIKAITDANEGFTLKTSVSRAWFESVNHGLFLAAMKLVDQAIRGAKINKSEIDEVLVVGESAQIPKVRELLQDFFDGKKLCTTIDSDQAAIFGTTIEAARLSNDISVPKLIVMNINPLSLSVMVFNGLSNIVVQKNTTIPANETFHVTLGAINESIVIDIFEGENANANENNLLGKLELLPIVKSDYYDIEVNFKIDSDGIVTFSVEDIYLGDIFEMKPIAMNLFK